MPSPTPAAVTVNDRSYAWPNAPVVAVCIDGSEPGYIEAAVTAGVAPFFGRLLREGTALDATCALPSFTNPNNLSIVTGRPPAVHGICGNYVLDPETGEAVMMNDPKFLTAPTLFSAFQRAGARVVVLTAKDKLRRLLAHGLSFAPGSEGEPPALAASAEKADTVTLADNGIDDLLGLAGRPLPEVYSADLSAFIFDAGVALMEQAAAGARPRPDLMYLSTTDYIQHKHAPGTPVANAFYAMMDRALARLDALGCVLVLTADHGMSAKHDPATGAPRVVWLQDLLDQDPGPDRARVILPITDPYVAHHGALGSFALVYAMGDDRGAEAIAALASRLAGLPGVTRVLPSDEAARTFDLPPGRLGDLVVLSRADTALGGRETEHDLSGLTEPLRSHGGEGEQRVPLILNRPVTGIDGRALRNFDAFDLALNHTTRQKE